MVTQYYTATSIDGFIADQQNSLDWLFEVPAEGGWSGQEDYDRFFAGVGALAMGSTTYHWLAEHIGFLDDPSAWPYSLPTWVFSSRELPRVAGPDIRFVSGDVVAVHRQMEAAADGRNVWLVGGGDLVGQFADAGLLDEVILTIAPVFLGGGAPLLPRRLTQGRLKLVEASQHGSTFATLRYAVRRR